MAVKVYPRSSGTPSLTRGNNDAKANGVAAGWVPFPLETSPGAGVSGVSLGTITGPTNGLEFISGSSPIEWISRPLSADFTISGTITLNIWGFEDNMSANLGFHVIIQRIDKTGAIVSQIASSERGVEAAVTTAGVNNWTVVPTSTNMLKGDRIRVRILINDVGTMALGFVGVLRLNGATANVDGDTWIQFTENLTFTALAEGAGSQVFLTDARDVAMDPAGNNSQKQALLDTRGAGSVVEKRNTIAGWTTPLTIRDNGEVFDVTWWTPQLAAFTLSGIVRAQLRQLVANSSASQMAMRCEIAVTDGDGTNAVVWAAVNQDSDTVSTSGNYGICWLSGGDLAVVAGQRIRLRVFIDDASASAMVAGFLVSLQVGGTAGESPVGNTYLRFEQTLTEFVAGNNWTATPADTLSLTDSITGIVVGRTASIADSVGVADAQTFLQAVQRVIADTAAVADNVDTVAAFFRTIAESTLGVADNVTAGLFFERVIADTLTVSDAQDVSLGHVRSIADSLGVSDAQAMVVAYSLIVADALGVADNAATALAAVLTLNDPLAVADTLATAQGFVRQIAEASLTLADNVVTVSGKESTINDTLTVNDTQSFQLGIARVVADSLNVADLATLVQAFNAVIPDTLGLADSIDPQLSGTGNTLNIDDALSVADAQVLLNTVQRVIADTLTVNDALVQSLGYGRSIADTLVLVDNVLSAVGFVRTIVDPLTVADAVVTQRAVDMVIADALALADTQLLVQSKSLIVGDLLQLDDLLDAMLQKNISINDVLAVTDFVDTRLGFFVIPGALAGRVRYARAGALRGSQAGTVRGVVAGHITLGDS